MTRVGFVTTSYPWGEGESFLTPELSRLLHDGDAVIVPTWPRGRSPEPALAQMATRALRHHPLSPVVVVAALVETMTHPRAAGRAISALWSGAAPTTFRNAAVLPKALWLSRTARRLGIGHLHAYWSGVPASLAMAAAAAGGLSWSMTAHRGDVVTANLVQRKVRAATFTRCISHATRRLVEAQVSGPGVGHLPVVHLGIELPEDVRPPRRPPARVLCAARLVSLKRHADLIRAFSSVVDSGIDVHLDLAGSGPEEGPIRRLMSDLGLDDRVHLLGHVPHANLLQHMGDGLADVVVLASEIEGIPVSLMEAMSVGVPVLATEVGGTAELLGGGAGLLVPPCDPEALAAALRLLLTDDELWHRLAVAGRARVRADFDARASAARVRDLLADV
ncbi:MAG: glycosyltransferase [Acidimicrobiales bacterium]